MSFEIKEIPLSDFDTFAYIMAEAYPGMQISTPEARTTMKKRLVKVLKDDRISCHGYYKGDQLLAGMRLFDYTMNLFGNEALVGGVGSIAVDLAYKKEHIAFELMKYYLNYYNKKDSPLLILYPFRPDFYRKMGFGYGTKISRYEIKPSALPNKGEKSNVRLLMNDDVEALAACYNQYAKSKTGMIKTPSVHWKLAMSLGEKSRFYGYFEEGQLTGYLRFVFKSLDTDGFLLNIMVINDLIYNDRKSLLGLLSFLNSQADQIEHIEFNLLDDNFHFLPSDPRDSSQVLIPSVYHQTNRDGMGLMYRILDIPRFIESLADRDFKGMTCKLNIKISDSFWEKNNSTFTILFDKGRAAIIDQVSKNELTIKLDIAEFSSLMMGVLDFNKLYEFGLADISDIEQLDMITALFAVKEKPVCLTAF